MGTTHRAVLIGVPLILMMGAGALALASVPHGFNTGDTLQAADLNTNFTALDQRLSALEAKEPMAGTFPAVLGLGTGNYVNQGPDIGGFWFCGAAPDSLNVSSAPLVPQGIVTFSHAFGSILFTNAGAVALNLDFPGPSAPCPTGNMCAAPLTFFLKSPREQDITIASVLDQAGAIYLDGAAVPELRNLGAFPNTSTIHVPARAFALSFLACSADGPTLAFAVYSQFLTNPDYSLTVDYDRTFHRNGQ